MNEDLPPPITKAEKVADYIAESIGTANPITQGEAIKKAGYSPITAKTPQRVTNTEAFKRRIELQNKRLAKLYTKHLQDNLAEAEKKRPKAGFRDLYYAADIMAKHRALITGQATENIATTGAIVMLPGDDMPTDKDTSQDKIV